MLPRLEAAEPADTVDADTVAVVVDADLGVKPRGPEAVCHEQDNQRESVDVQLGRQLHQEDADHVQ